MVGELVTFGIQKLWDLLSREHAKFQGVDDQVTELKTDLNTLKSFVKDADAKQHTSARVRNCVEVINEIIFDADDIIETFIQKKELGKNGGIKKHIRRLACIIPEHRKIAFEIGNLSKRISKVIRDMQSFGVQQIIADVRDPQPLQERQEFAREYESNLVGLEANVEKLVGYLVEKDDVQVVSMTGMGGLGKTTLARQAFHHDKVKERFDRLVWVCVSQNCDRKNVWQTILQNFRSKAEEKEILEMTEFRLQEELFGLLETFKSLIVFDDIWKEEDWGLIKQIFPHKGWKVLLTSRNDSIAESGEKHINFKPECLSDQDSWTLFQRIAMPRKDASDKHLNEELKNVDMEMEELGRQMIKHCRGLPLAVRVLGGMLASKYTLRDWKRLSENIGSHLVGRTNEDKNSSFNRVLSLSYEELPGYLKYCFLYMAHFPEDYEINVENLSYLWAGEGRVRYNNGETIRDVGESYIEELVRRNMVISERDNTTSRFKTCGLHDLMREICISKAEEENFVQIFGIQSTTAHTQSLGTSRRFVSQYPTTLDVERQISNSKVRSLVVVIKNLTDFWRLSSVSFKRLQLLRVLHLRGAEFKGGKLPYSIGKLIHLRYLNLEIADISHLPSSLGNLKLLIFLNLNVITKSIFIPDVLMRMKELRCLALPGAMDKKTKLELSDLVNLEKLVHFSTENCNLEDLRGMARLRTLEIIVTGENSLEALSASIAGLRHLEYLGIIYSGAKATKIWRSLSEFNNLKQLRLSIEIPLLYDELQFPSRLTSLFLDECFLEEDPMPILEKLGQLKEVCLFSNSFCGRRMVCSTGGFPQLQELVLWELKELEEWIVEEGSMPLLHILEINYCEKLKELPDGLQFLTFLKHLTVSNCGEDHWKKRLSEGGEDYHKIQHIPSVIIN